MEKDHLRRISEQGVKLKGSEIKRTLKADKIQRVLWPTTNDANTMIQSKKGL